MAGASVDEALVRADLRDALGLLASHTSRRGSERDVAHALAVWAHMRWPHLRWRVEEFGAQGANLVASVPGSGRGETLLYSHLDTSLTGDVEWDGQVTGRFDEITAWSWDESAGTTSGFGWTVARLPAAAAMVGFAQAMAEQPDSGATLLLAGSGTHRSPFAGESTHPTGVEHYLATHVAPRQAIVAKCGPPGPLHHEPGAMFVRVRVTGHMWPAMMAQTVTPVGGLPLHLGVVMSALAAWREGHLLERKPVGQIAPEVGIGSVRAGQPAKPDLLSAGVEIHGYVVLIDHDDPRAIAASLERQLRAALDTAGLAHLRVTVDFHVEHPAAATPANAPIVDAAHEAWRTYCGVEPLDVSGWKGSTDGVVLRAAGADVVRVGPTPHYDPEDSRLDRIAIPDLVNFALLYRDLVSKAGNNTSI